MNIEYNDLKSRGFSIGKDSLFRMMDEAFAIYLVARVERFDPSVVRREMSNRKAYLYDNGLATPLKYPSADDQDQGKLLENLVFRHLGQATEEIYFLRNGWECGFVAFPQAGEPTLVQVTTKLDQDNLGREIKGLDAGRTHLGTSTALLLYDTIQPGLDIPDWVRAVPVLEWVLT